MELRRRALKKPSQGAIVKCRNECVPQPFNTRRVETDADSTRKLIFCAMTPLRFASGAR